MATGITVSTTFQFSRINRMFSCTWALPDENKRTPTAALRTSLETAEKRSGRNEEIERNQLKKMHD
jgi:hypothetical protein